jgi:hypothetical protein
MRTVMSQIRRRRLLTCHKLLKRRLRSLGLRAYADAENLVGQDAVDTTEVMGRSYKLTIRADEFPPDGDIVVAAFLGKRGFPCGEGYSCGYLVKRQGAPRYLSQKKLWTYGY